MKKVKIKIVYVAECCYDYEGFSIIGIYSTKKKAEKACKKDNNGDSHEVESFLINQEVK